MKDFSLRVMRRLTASSCKLLLMVVVSTLLIGCKSYEKRKDKMIRSIAADKEVLRADKDHAAAIYALDDFEKILQYLQDKTGLNFFEYCVQKEQESLQDLALAGTFDFSIAGVYSGNLSSTSDGLHKTIPAYHEDFKHYIALLAKVDSLHLHSSDGAERIARCFQDALTESKRIDRRMNEGAAMMQLMLLLSGQRMAGIESYAKDMYRVMHDAYTNVLEVFDQELSDGFECYYGSLFNTIKGYSTKLEKDEFFAIYNDLLRQTAPSYLGPHLAAVLFLESEEDDADDIYADYLDICAR